MTLTIRAIEPGEAAAVVAAGEVFDSLPDLATSGRFLVTPGHHLLIAYQESLVSLEQLRCRIPELRKQDQAVQAELQSLETAAGDETHEPPSGRRPTATAMRSATCLRRCNRSTHRIRGTTPAGRRD